MKEPVESDARFGARAVAAGLALALVAVPFALLLLLVQGEWRPLLSIDEGARDDLNAFALDEGWFVEVMKAFSTVGDGATYWVVFAGVCAWLLFRGQPRLAAFAGVTMFGSMLLNRAVKAAVDRARPVLEEPVAQAHGLSFPSGHAQSAMVAFTTLLFVFWPRLSDGARRAAAAVAAVMVLAIGFSRIALGVHFVSDVLAGYVLGAAWFAAMVAVFNAWRRDLATRP